jgi:hypothetical protein
VRRSPFGVHLDRQCRLGGPHTVSNIATFLADPEAHDFTPIPTALTTLYPNVFPYDQRGVLRSANDCAGAWSKNAA